MALLTATGLQKYFGERLLFDGVSFEVGGRDRVGLTGSNGCGKTTLLRLLTGELSPDAGTIARAKELRIGYLQQYVCKDPQATLYQEMVGVFAPLMALEEELEQVQAALLQREDAALLERQQTLREEFEAGGGLYYESRARAALAGLGFASDDFSRPVSSLSGGQKTKLAMGRLLLSDSNLLLLDEPTNHLDIGATQWLEEFLTGYGGALIVISHDRYFLDRVTTRTMELCGGRLFSTAGNYTAHREKRRRDQLIEQKHFQTGAREIRRMEESIALLKSFNREKSVRAAESKEKALARLKQIIQAPPPPEQTLRFQFAPRFVSGNEVLMAERLCMTFQKPLFQDVSFTLRRGERVFLLGPNGCGKTTLLKLLMGQLTPTSGAFRLGAKVQIGYYDQAQDALRGDKTAFEQVADAYPAMSHGEIRGAMAAFLFRGDEVFKPVSLLSGGERARLLLLLLMLSGANLLLLDEPTNHLDIASREALEEALEAYDGTLLMVSHDRYFINRLSSRVLRLTAKGCEECGENYEAYAAQLEKEASVAPAKRPEKDEKKRPSGRASDAKRRQTAARIRNLEAEIAKEEAALEALKNALSSNEAAADYERLLALTAEIAQQQQIVDRLMEEWMRLCGEAGD